jgi:hypothetical protein
MTDTRRTLIQAQSWQAGASVDLWIDVADWAVLHPAGVTLPLEEVEDGYMTVMLHLGPDGLVAETELHLDPDNLESHVGDDWDVTRSWAQCEDHLRAQRAADELEPLAEY